MKIRVDKSAGIVAALITASSFAISQDRLNGREALEACKNGISDTYAIENKIQFSLNTVSALKEAPIYSG